MKLLFWSPHILADFFSDIKYGFITEECLEIFLSMRPAVQLDRKVISYVVIGLVIPSLVRYKVKVKLSVIN
jgi:hypothetical protein